MRKPAQGSEVGSPSSWAREEQSQALDLDFLACSPVFFLPPHKCSYFSFILYSEKNKEKSCRHHPSTPPLPPYTLFFVYTEISGREPYRYRIGGGILLERLNWPAYQKVLPSWQWTSDSGYSSGCKQWGLCLELLHSLPLISDCACRLWLTRTSKWMRLIWASIILANSVSS